MEIIYGGRQTGKTKRLIELAAEAEAKGQVSYIVCTTQREAYRIAKLAEELEMVIGFPITYDEMLSVSYAASNIKNFYIDNAEMLLRSLTPVTIAAITMNKSESEEFGG